MGLDAVELLLELEERFGISISQAEGEAVLGATAGTIHRYLVAKLKGEYQEAPRIEPLSKEVAQAVASIAGWWKRSTDLNKRFSPAAREESWRALERSLGVSLPPLEQPADEAFPRIPRQCGSILSLTYWIAEHHPERVEWVPVPCKPTGETAASPWREEEIWSILRECICNVLGVKAEQVNYDTRMIEDLGMG